MGSTEKQSNSDDTAVVEQLYRKVKRQQSFARMIIGLSITVVIILFTYWTTASNTLFTASSWLVTAVLVGVFGVGAILLAYLQGGRRIEAVREFNNYRSANYVSLLNEISQRVADLEERVGATQGRVPTSRSALSNDERQNLVARLHERIQNAASEQFICTIRNELERERSHKDMQQRGDITTQRLRQEIADLSRRGNLNLVLGILTTLTGIGLLGWIVFNRDLNLTTPLAAIAYFLPRIALVILIEVFAYFFLSLYRRSLNEIQYFQNELTNVEHKILAANVADQLNDSEAMRAILIQFAFTDRNRPSNVSTVDSGSNGQEVIGNALKSIRSARTTGSE